MKKIAIITMHAVKNYGSVLQTYATQRLFQKRELEPVVIDYRRPWDTGKAYYFDIKNKTWKDIVRQIVYFPSKFRQKKVFGDFLQKYINLTKYTYHNISDFERHPCIADIYCTGSDQVWNSGWNRGVKEEFFLTFVKEGKKKISYAASIGKEEIENDEKLKIKKYLSTYSAVSVRERSSVNLLNALGIQDVNLVIDPTLQLSQEEWRELLKTKERRYRNYVLLVQLNRNREFDVFAQRFAKENNKTLLRLCLRLDQIVLPGKAVVIPDVTDYLWLIDDADYVLTDSFHAVSFSLNFEKNFYAVLPKKYSSRIVSILNDLNLEKRIVSDYTLAQGQVEDIEYTKVNEKIAELRRQSDKYIDFALN